MTHPTTFTFGEDELPVLGYAIFGGRLLDAFDGPAFIYFAADEAEVAHIVADEIGGIASPVVDFPTGTVDFDALVDA